MTENELSHGILGAAIEVHKILGPGLLESAYETALEKELKLRKIEVKRQVGLPLIYKDAKCDLGYRVDLLVGSKAVDAINDIH